MKTHMPADMMTGAGEPRAKVTQNLYRFTISGHPDKLDEMKSTMEEVMMDHDIRLQGEFPVVKLEVHPLRQMQYMKFGGLVDAVTEKATGGGLEVEADWARTLSVAVGKPGDAAKKRVAGISASGGVFWDQQVCADLGWDSQLLELGMRK